jgi:hypothetical protein
MRNRVGGVNDLACQLFTVGSSINVPVFFEIALTPEVRA